MLGKRRKKGKEKIRKMFQKTKGRKGHLRGRKERERQVRLIVIRQSSKQIKYINYVKLQYTPKENGKM